MASEYGCVVTGVGMVSALGVDAPTGFARLLAGDCGAQHVEKFRAAGLDHSVAAVIDRAPIEARLRSTGFSEAAVQALGWPVVLGLVAAREALVDAASNGAHTPGGSIKVPEPLENSPLLVACAVGDCAMVPNETATSDGDWRQVNPALPNTIDAYHHGGVVGRLANALGAKSEVLCLTSTCAAANYALGEGLARVRAGAPKVLVGGLEALSTLAFIAFHQIRALGDVGRPFDVHREGLLFGEGAGFLVLERQDLAESRHARMYATLRGIGYGNDAVHMVAPDMEARGAILAMRSALCDAQVDAQSVQYINAHGTGTHHNALMESRAIAEVVGRDVPVSSLKGAIGHTMAGAAALEAVVTVLALAGGRLPATTGCTEVEPACGVRILIQGEQATWPESLADPYGAIPQEPKVHRATELLNSDRTMAPPARPPPAERVSLNNAFGFGGNNAVSVFSGVERASLPSADLEQRRVFIHGGTAVAGSAFGREAVFKALHDVERGVFPEARVEYNPGDFLGRKGLRKVCKNALLLSSAVAYDLPQWPEGFFKPSEAGCIMGSVYPAYTGLCEALRAQQKGNATALSPMAVAFGAANAAPSWFLMRRGIKGYNGSISGGASCGLDAVRMGHDLVASGKIQTILSGGVDSHDAHIWQSYADRNLPTPMEMLSVLQLSATTQGAWAEVGGFASAFNAENPSEAVGAVLDELMTMDSVRAFGVGRILLNRQPTRLRTPDALSTVPVWVLPFPEGFAGASALLPLLAAASVANGPTRAPIPIFKNLPVNGCAQLALAWSDEGFVTGMLILPV